MQRLLEAELIYGRLLTLSEPHLVERYNKALTGFGLRPTALGEFDIDMTGFSPQIAAELGDRDYLDPNRVNRRFIILTPEQVNLPVIHTGFSNTAGLMHEFFKANAKAINAVTIKDALYGEIEDNVTKVEHMEDLLSINEVTFKVLSAKDILSKATRLRALMDRLVSVEDAWRDNAMLAEMVELAKETGDIRQNQLVPDQLVFRHQAFWANHFGGIYVFHDARNVTVIASPDVPGFRKARPWQANYIDINDIESLYGFLAKTGRLQLPQASWVLESGLLQHRADMALIGLANEADPSQDTTRLDAVSMQTWAIHHADLVSQDGTVPFLNEVIRTLKATGRISMAAANSRILFHLVRAEPTHPDIWLINRLIAQKVPHDFISRFIFDKEGFYAAYEQYSDSFRDYVVSTLEKTYLGNKAALRKRLYGIERE